jgi:hypothetical protein
VEIAGASSDARLLWAARRVGEGVSSKCWEGGLVGCLIESDGRIEGVGCVGAQVVICVRVR